MAKAILALGNISTPLLLFGGPYSNLQALQALREEAEHRSIPAKQCICTGDIVAYCAQAKETVAEIRDWGVHCLMGNCEASLAEDADDCGCGFAKGSTCDLLSAQWFSLAKQQLGRDERKWFASLPQNISATIHGFKTLFVHGSVSSINRFIFPSTEIDTFQQELNLSNADMIIAGHCGIPFTKQINQRLWHNPGVIGMPANDGTPRTWFSIITASEADKKPFDITIYPLDYDYQQAHQAMLQAKLNKSYANALCSGLWPNTDILPPKDKLSQGKPLTF